MALRLNEPGEIKFLTDVPGFPAVSGTILPTTASERMTYDVDAAKLFGLKWEANRLKFLVSRLKSWDIESSEGKIATIDSEMLERVPPLILKAIERQINGYELSAEAEADAKKS